MAVLHTPRLRLEPLCDAHFAGLHAMNGEPEVMRYLGGHAATPEDTRATIVRVQARWDAWGYGWWALIDRATSEFLGAACLQHLDQDSAMAHEIGWRLRRASWGGGLAVEAARRILGHAFDVLGAPRVCAIRHPDNLRSQRTMERLGMRHVGRHGAQADAPALHELTRADWLARHIESRP